MRVVSCEELQSLRAPNPADPDPRPEELAPANVPKDEAGISSGALWFETREDALLTTGIK
jgi:hypothetical protein